MSTPRNERPRPQYGEYATPEQQRAAIREPLPEPAVIAEESVMVQPAPVGEPLTGRDAFGRPVPAASTAQAKPAGDRVFTLILLALGLVSVFVIGIPMASLSALLPETLLTLGVAEEYANISRPAAWDYLLCAVWVFGYIFTAFFSLRRMRAGKLSWWIPLVGFVVTMIVFNIVAAQAYGNDPGLQEYMRIMLEGSVPTPAP